MKGSKEMGRIKRDEHDKEIGSHDIKSDKKREYGNKEVKIKMKREGREKKKKSVKEGLMVI